MKILILEDNVKLAQNIQEYLKYKGIKSEIDFDGLRGYQKILDNHYDILILDINLPNKNGLDICADLRRKNINIPIIMLTSRNSSLDKIQGLNLGSDDYLGKPFDMEELVSRLEALYRRTATEKNNIIHILDLEIDILKREVKKNGKIINLSVLEFDLLKYLVLNRGVPIDRKTLLETVWGDFDKHMFSRSVDVYIGYLRKKLGENLIETKKGYGYVINS